MVISSASSSSTTSAGIGAYVILATSTPSTRLPLARSCRQTAPTVPHGARPYDSMKARASSREDGFSRIAPSTAPGWLSLVTLERSASALASAICVTRANGSSRARSPIAFSSMSGTTTSKGTPTVAASKIARRLADLEPSTKRGGSVRRVTLATAASIVATEGA
eukprot:scaffold134_cov61-Phaeocystis_antarctica.AAC.4